ncbi:MAG: hypothetical protein ACK4UN_09915 [Limisphaerales bacterium]
MDQTKISQEFKIGSDRVTRIDGRLIIHAKQEMDWPIREFCRVPIYVSGEKYYLRTKRPAEAPFAMIYELWPWPADLFEASPKSIVYDQEYVQERNREASSNRNQSVAYILLFPFYPFLGLFWSGFKNNVLNPIGFEPGSISRASVFLVFNLSVLEAIFAGWMGGGMLAFYLNTPALVKVDRVLLFLFAFDALFRFSRSLNTDHQDHWGFCEWLFAWALNRR